MIDLKEWAKQYPKGYVSIGDACRIKVNFMRSDAQYKAFADNLNEDARDARIGRLVRQKLVSGNDIPVERCTIKASEVLELDRETP